MSAPWKNSNPPKDGTLIVAVGRVIYEFCGTGEDDFGADSSTATIGTCSEPFVAEVRWTANKNESAGWHYLSGLAVARTLEDEVKIDFWLEAPSTAFDDYLQSIIPQIPLLPEPDLEILAENA